MNTQHTTAHTDDRLSALERSTGRWRMAAICSITLLTGIIIGGMGMQPDTNDPKAVVGITGTADSIYRIHMDGSITYIRIPKGERSVNGFFDWGDVEIDHSRKSRTIPQ